MRGAKLELGVFQEKICPVCKKTFLPAVQHVYKRITYAGRLATYCGWNCMRAAERAEKARKEQRKKKGQGTSPKGESR